LSRPDIRRVQDRFIERGAGAGIIIVLRQNILRPRMRRTKLRKSEGESQRGSATQ